MIDSPYSTYREFSAGDIIMRQGDKGDNAYVIEDGIVEILIEHNNGDVLRVGTRGAGSIIGEMAMVDDAPRTATVRAVEACKMLEITRSDFASRLKTTDPVLQMVTRVILARYRDMITRAEILREGASFPPPELLEQDAALETDAVEAIKISNEFLSAIHNGHIWLAYQPIINFKDGTVAGFEALMRWEHPEKGFISPGIFIPIVEASGAIVEASRWALKESCEALQRIEDRIGSNRSMYMSVNFSSTDFAEESFVDNTYRILSESDVDASQVCLEITERLLMGQPENAKETLNMCREAGMGIAIDDFGTGYSSLSYLYYFPIDTLKIDRSFISVMQKERQSLEIVKSIIGLGQSLNMRTIAEGVETPEEAKLLYDLGCDMAQGYYFGKPLSEKEVTQALLNWSPKKY